MKNKLIQVAVLMLSAQLVLAGCSSGPAPAEAGPSQATGRAGADATSEIPRYTPTPPPDARSPDVGGALESHPGDAENFYVDSQDYVVWAKPSANTEATWEYRVVSFDDHGFQSSAFLKYVFPDEHMAQRFAETDDLLEARGEAVYYRGWFGPQVQDKEGVVELATTEGEEYFVSRPEG